MPPERPNILFMHVDQMHAEAMSAYGNPHVRTPNLDRLAADGHSFMANYTAMPQCCPARATWYTGRMSTEHGVVVNSCPILPDIPDLGQWLRRHAGYECVYTGKWHVSGRNVRESFDVLLDGGQGELNDAALARSAVTFLRNRQPSERPFFLNIGFMNPHDCCYTAGANGGLGKFLLADEMEDDLPPLPPSFVRNPSYAGRTGGWAEKDWRFYIYTYYRMVEMVDAEIGRVYDALQRSLYRDNTIVIFTADHGDGLGFHGKLSKGFLEEEAWRVPAIVVLPGRPNAGTRDTEHLTGGADIPATICDYAGTPPLPAMTVGRSWRPIFEGENPPWRDTVVGETSIGGTAAAVRDKRFKTIFYRDKPSSVYDLIDDPAEMNNLAGTDAGRATESRHRQALRTYLSTITPCPEPGPGARLKPGQRAIYRNVLDWYGQLAREGAEG